MCECTQLKIALAVSTSLLRQSVDITFYARSYAGSDELSEELLLDELEELPELPEEEPLSVVVAAAVTS